MRSLLSVFLFLALIVSVSAQDRASAYENLDSLFSAGSFKEVLALEQRYASILAGRDTIAANAWYYFGEAYHQQGDYNSAINYFFREAEIREALSVNYPDVYSDMMYSLTQVLIEGGKTNLAKENALKQLTFDRRVFGRDSEAYYHSVILYSDVLLVLEKLDAAEDILRSDIGSAAKNSQPLYGLMLAKLANVYSFQGRYSKANESFIKSLELIREHFGKASDQYQLNLANYGYSLLTQGKYDLAEDYLSTALEFIEQSVRDEHDDSYFALLNQLALAFQQMGQYESAEKNYREILQHDSTILGRSHPDFAITLSNAGVLYADQKKYSVAEKALLKSISILRENKMEGTVTYARALNILAKIYQLSGRQADAIPLLKQSLAIFAKTPGKKTHEYATALFILGSAYLQMGSPQTLKTLEECRKLRANLFGTAHPLYAQVLEKLAVYHWQKKSQKNTQGLLQEMFRNYYAQIDNFFPVLTEEEKSNFYFRRFRPSVELYSSWVIQTQRDNRSALGDLYSVVINTKGMILYATEKVKKKILESKDTSLIGLYDKWESQKEMLAYLYGQSHSSTRIDSLIRSSNELEKELSKRSVDFSREIIRPKHNWNEVRNTLKNGEAAIEVVRYAEFLPDSAAPGKSIRYAALILAHEMETGPEIVLLDNGKEMEKRGLIYYRNGIALKFEDKLSYNLYWKKIKDKLDELNITKVYFSPDGVYNVIALNSIRNPATGKFVIEETVVKTTTSTRDLLTSRDGSTVGNGYILFGFPSFKVEDITEDSTEIAAPSLSRSIRGSLTRFLRGGGGISELPGTHTEVMEIRKMLGNENTSVFVEDKANEVQVKTSPTPKVMHLATHGYFFEDSDVAGFHPPNPLLSSGLILAGASNFIASGVNPLHPDEDGILTAYEAMNLDLNGTDLVILSACETGLGHQRNGEGVYGLQRAFYLAGAKAVVMSLWSVDDQATRELMINFYKNWGETGNVDESFRNAQLALMKKFPEPYYWAAFVVVGD